MPNFAERCCARPPLALAIAEHRVRRAAAGQFVRRSEAGPWTRPSKSTNEHDEPRFGRYIRSAHTSQWNTLWRVPQLHA